MDERLRKRIIMFYLAGIINIVLGLYVLLQGASVLPSDKVMMLSFFFFAFAAVDFYFPYMMKKKWRAEQEKAMRSDAGQNATR
jgi:Predicted membrane protein